MDRIRENRGYHPILVRAIIFDRDRCARSRVELQNKFTKDIDQFE